MTDTFTARIDPHVHSEGSYDADDPVELILEQANDIGLDAVVITDHDTIEESLRAAELASEFDLVGIPGVELSTADGHLLALGVDEMPEPRRPLMESIAEVRELGGAAVIPHPFQRSRHGVRKRHITDCDALEVYNSWLFTGYRNRRARRFADARGFPGVAASDAHSVHWVGRAYTEIALDGISSRDELTADHIIDAIKNGSTAIYGRRKPIHRSARHYARAAGKQTGYAVKSQAASAASWLLNP